LLYGLLCFYSKLIQIHGINFYLLGIKFITKLNFFPNSE